MQDIGFVEGRRVAVFGTGLEAVKCIHYLQKKGIDVVYFLNNNCKIGQFCGCPVFEPDTEKVRNVFILVATKELVYSIISKQLEESGLSEFKDYIYYEWAYKKLVLLHGNCHMTIIRLFLLSSGTFGRQYSIYPNPLICENKKGKIENTVLENCDLWVHEDIQEDNGFSYFLSDAYMRKFIRSDTVEVVIPNLFGLGKAFFPQSEGNYRNNKIKNGEDTNGMFPHADKVIDKCVEQGMKKEKIIEFCMRDDAISRNEIKENFRLYIEKMRIREQCWDIKIVDYILENYKKRKLFYDMGHPANEILEVISKGVLERLGITAESVFADEKLDVHEEPVYPAVIKTLEMNWDNGLIRKSPWGKKACNEMDFKEYIEEYLWWCYGIQ